MNNEKIKYTPGPWELNTAGSSRRGEPFLVTEIYVYAPNTQDDTAICGDVIDPVTQEPSESNARLISAAPNLLESQIMGQSMNTPDFLDWIADRLVNVYGERPDVDFVRSLRERAEAGRSAIAKAAGEQS